MERNRLDPDEPSMLEDAGAVNALMPRPGEAGLRGYLPDQPDWLRAVQHNPIVSRFLGEALPLALMGMRASAGAGGGTLPLRPRTMPEGEWPIQAAKMIQVGGENHTFAGGSHMEAVRKAQAVLGDEVFDRGGAVPMPSNMFITNKGRVVSAEEAGRMLDEHNQTNHYTSHWLTGRPKKGKDSLLSEALDLYDPTTGREKQ